jgi:hypothetical protein
MEIVETVMAGAIDEKIYRYSWESSEREDDVDQLSQPRP